MPSTIENSPLVIAVIGCGTMGTSIVSGVLDATSKASVPSTTAPQISRVIACVRTQSSANRVAAALSEHASRVTAEGVPEALAGKLLISVLAGICTTNLAECIYGEGRFHGRKCYIARAMPNIAAQIRQSMTVIASTSPPLPTKFRELTEWIFNQVGQTKSIAESQFDIAAVLVGCSGSLMMLPIDGLLDGCVAEGLKRSEAIELVTQSVLGNLKLVAHGEHPSILREKIASPGGCSIRALLRLEAGGVRTSFAEAIMEAAFQSRNMGAK